MLIESKLRTRIIETLSWMIKDMRHRFDEIVGNLCFGEQGGYSPELMKAIRLLDELEATPPAPTEQQCRDLAVAVGKTESWGSGYFRQYGSQGWVKAHGCAITDVRMHMVQLRNSGVEYPDAPLNDMKIDSSGLTPRQRHIQETGR